MITQIIKGTYNNKGSYNHGQPCVAIVMESHQHKKRFILYCQEPEYQNGEWPSSLCDELHEASQMKLNDDYVQIWPIEDAKNECVEEYRTIEKRRQPGLFHELFGNNVSKLNVEFSVE